MKILPALGLFVAVASFGAHAEATKTVCTITVNSADEKEALRSRLPKGRYRFVELVEKGREDWLASSCRKAVECDVLVVSGHFNAGDTFYSDRIDNDAHLRIDELERAACSASCPALFGRLKEVYLFGCESLNPDATRYASSDGESGRERMRRIFARVPSIYGFSSSAPVGATAGMLLNRYFDAGGAGRFASGEANERLLRIFGRNSMTRTRGVGDTRERREACRFFDSRPAAEKLAFVHALLREDVARMGEHFTRMERMFAAIPAAERQHPAYAQALAELSADEDTRARYLALTRSTAAAQRRARMIAFATTLGWLSPGQERAESMALVNDLLAAKAMGYAEVDLVCALNADRRLDAERGRLAALPAGPRVAQQAALACLGDREAHGRVVASLASPAEGDVRIAQAYLRHRPIEDARELRGVARGVVQMPASGAQVRALDALGRLNIADREILDELARTFAAARSPAVQQAIAEVFIRSGHSRPGLASVLREHRLTAPGRGGLVDALLARLESGG